MRTEKRYSLVCEKTITKEAVYHARYHSTEEDPGNKEFSR